MRLERNGSSSLHGSAMTKTTNRCIAFIAGIAASIQVVVECAVIWINISTPLLRFTYIYVNWRWKCNIGCTLNMCWFTQIKDLGAPVHPRKKLFWSRDSNRVLTTREQCRSADGQSKLDGSNVCSNVRPIHSNSGPALSLNPPLTNNAPVLSFIEYLYIPRAC